MSSRDVTEILFIFPRAFGSREEYVGLSRRLSTDELIEVAIGGLEEALYRVCRPDGYEIEDANVRETRRGWVIYVTYYCGGRRMATQIAVEQREDIYVVTIREPTSKPH